MNKQILYFHKKLGRTSWVVLSIFYFGNKTKFRREVVKI